MTQKIIEQDLDGALESANEKAQYSWQKDEIAWYYSSIWRDIFKVQFTGEHWLSGNKWKFNKIYQFKYLDDYSGNHDINIKGIDNNGISHGNENCFYTTKEAAVEFALKHIENIKNYALKEYEKDSLKIKKYAEN